MPELKDHALLLRRIPYSDTSLICHFLTREHGRLTLMARGARRAKSPFRATLALLHDLRISWRPGKTGMGNLVDAERGMKLLDEHLDINGLELCSVTSGLFQDGDPHGYSELLEAMNILQHHPADSALYMAIWKLLELSGWVGDFQHCWRCGKAVDKNAPMSWHTCQLICDSCGRGMAVSAGMRKGIAAQSSHANVRLAVSDISCWQRMIQDVLREHGLRPVSFEKY